MLLVTRCQAIRTFKISWISIIRKEDHGKEDHCIMTMICQMLSLMSLKTLRSKSIIEILSETIHLRCSRTIGWRYLMIWVVPLQVPQRTTPLVTSATTSNNYSTINKTTTIVIMVKRLVWAFSLTNKALRALSIWLTTEINTKTTKPSNMTTMLMIADSSTWPRLTQVTLQLGTNQAVLKVIWCTPHLINSRKVWKTQAVYQPHPRNSSSKKCSTINHSPKVRHINSKI